MDAHVLEQCPGTEKRSHASATRQIPKSQQLILRKQSYIIRFLSTAAPIGRGRLVAPAGKFDPILPAFGKTTQGSEAARWPLSRPKPADPKNFAGRKRQRWTIGRGRRRLPGRATRTTIPRSQSRRTARLARGPPARAGGRRGWRRRRRCPRGQAHRALARNLASRPPARFNRPRTRQGARRPRRRIFPRRRR